MRVCSGKRENDAYGLGRFSVKELGVKNRSSYISENIVDIHQSEREIGSHVVTAFDYPDQDYL